jgi:hypothetical protein
MERSPSLGHIDRCASEHGVDPLREAAFASRMPEECDRPVGHPMRRLAQVNTGGFGAQALPPQGIADEEVQEMQMTHFPVMLSQRLPNRPISQQLKLSHLFLDHGCPARV